MELALRTNRDMQPTVNAAYERVVSGAARGLVSR
jgi:hypothetical protein